MACYRRDGNDNPIVEGARRPHQEEWGDLVDEEFWCRMDELIVMRQENANRPPPPPVLLTCPHCAKVDLKGTTGRAIHIGRKHREPTLVPAFA